MSSLRYDYLHNLDADSKAYLQMQSAFNARLPLIAIKVPPTAISPDGTECLHCVEATKRNNRIYIRVITNTDRGVNIMIPCNTVEMYYKFMDLRFQVRNRDKVMVTFPELYVSHSGRKHELYLRASDFKLNSPEVLRKQNWDIDITNDDIDLDDAGLNVPLH